MAESVQGAGSDVSSRANVAAGSYTGWRAGRPRPRGRALAAVVVGGLLFAAILGWIVVALIDGDL